jgi:hypothetical protein
MRNIIEIAIDRETDLLDTIIESPALLDGPAWSWTPVGLMNPLTRKFSTRGTSRARIAKDPESKRRYLN